MAIKCPICQTGECDVKFRNLKDGPGRRGVIEQDGLDLAECPKCSVLFFHPMPTINELIAYHNEQYFVAPSQALQKGYPDYTNKEHRWSKIAWGRRMISWFLQTLPPQERQGEKKVLSIGEAMGYMLKGMQFLKWRCVGQDISAWAVNYGRRYEEVDLRCGRLQDMDFSDIEPFDFILCWDSFEHDPEPHSLLEKIYAITVSNMTMIVQMPDASFADSADWYYFSPGQHAFIYTRKSFEILLTMHGFFIYQEKLSSESDSMVLVIKKQNSDNLLCQSHVNAAVNGLMIFS